MTGTVYVLRNIENGKCYVGQTKLSLKRRFSQHKCHGRMLIGHAIRKYGDDSFERFEYKGIPTTIIDDIERDMIRTSNSIAPFGYNLHGGGQRNRVVTEETKQKISKANKGRKRTQTAIDAVRIKNTGQKRSELQCHNISNALRGIPKSDKHKRNLGESRRLNGVAKGAKNPSARAVVCVETGEVFQTMKEAGEKYNRTIGNICGACRGFSKTSAGMHWEYFKGDM